MHFLRVLPAIRFTLALGASLFFATQAHAQVQSKPAATAASSVPAACPAILQHTFPRLQDDAPQNLCQYTGKVILVVNTASYCGFTSQYEGLEKLYADLGPKGLVVLGFPSNDFGKQEPGSSKEIADFCFNTYGVKFPMFEKSVVKGPQASALYTALAKAADSTPKWNFHKYLIDRNGKVLGAYTSLTSPSNSGLVNDIKKALDNT
jgi:glutathione peroxidase